MQTTRSSGWMGAFSAAFLLAGCGGERTTEPPAMGAPALAAVIIEAHREPLERQLDGAIEAVNQGTVAAQTSGRVAEILYDVNDFVPAGAVILRLSSKEQRSSLEQAQAALREATAREAEAQANFRRIAGVYEKGVVAKAAFDEAQANRDSAVARLASAEAAVVAAREGVSYTEIRAPYAGVVTRRHVEVGETVAPGTALVSGLSLQYLRVAVDVPQSIVDQVRRLRKAVVYVGDRRIEATQLTVFPQAALPSSTFRARLELPQNATDLYPGMFVKVGLIVGEQERLRIPASAVVERSEVTAVYVLDAEGLPMLQQVRLGGRSGDTVEVLAGLRSGDRIAADPVAAMRYSASPRR